MAYKACEDCGNKTYNGFCPNCQEEVFIEEQCEDLGITVPEKIAEKAQEHRFHNRTRI